MPQRSQMSIIVVNKSTWDVHEGVKKVDNIKSSYENIHDRKIVKNDKIQQFD